MTKWADNILDLFATYDTFIIDQWGVLHGGQTVYPGVVEALQDLQRAGKRTIILTNSSKTESVNIDRLDRLGVPRSLYTSLVSSADIVRREIFAREQAQRTMIFVVATGHDAALLDGLPVECVPNIEEANLVLLLSAEAPITLDQHQAWIEGGADRRLPLLAPSADTQSVSPALVSAGLGLLTAEYARLGGDVTVVGKPEQIIYDECFQRLDKPPSRAIAIGDQICSDVVGAKRYGLDAALVLTGAAATLIKPEATLASTMADVARASKLFDTTIDWVVPSFA